MASALELNARIAAHKDKMQWKADQRASWYARNGNRPFRTNKLLGEFPASINRHTGKPHEHKRAIARALSREA